MPDKLSPSAKQAPTKHLEYKMKLTNKPTATLLAAVLTLSAVGSAFAFGSHGHGCDMGRYQASPMRALYQLDSLTDEQRTELKKVMKDERNAMRDLFDAMQDNRVEMQQAIRKNVTADKIEPLAKKQGELVTKMTIARAKMRDKINAILSDEQRKELNMMRSSKGRDDDDRERSGYRGW
jgi:Spy/CpxP family protein refolding chaperone